MRAVSGGSRPRWIRRGEDASTFRSSNSPPSMAWSIRISWGNERFGLVEAEAMKEINECCRNLSLNCWTWGELVQISQLRLPNFWTHIWNYTRSSYVRRVVTIKEMSTYLHLSGTWSVQYSKIEKWWEMMMFTWYHLITSKLSIYLGRTFARVIYNLRFKAQWIDPPKTGGQSDNQKAGICVYIYIYIWLR